MKKISWSLFKEYFPLTMVILFGCVMIYFGTILILNYWVPVRISMGIMGNVVLAPFIVGLALVGLGFAELLSKTKE